MTPTQPATGEASSSGPPTGETTAEPSLSLPPPHAFHLNLPPHFFDAEGVPYVTRFGALKAQQAIDLALSMQLTENVFIDHTPSCSSNHMRSERSDGGADVIQDAQNAVAEEAMGNNDDDDAMLDDDEVEVETTENQPETLDSLAKKCNRLNTILSSLESLKFGGISQSILMDLVLHLLRLVTATITYDDVVAMKGPTLHWENVGTVVKLNGTSDKDAGQDAMLDYKLPESEQELAAELKQSFALPTPTRESLLLTLINLLSNKGPLRSVSNAAIFPPINNSANNERSLLILQWKPLLRMLLRTAPYLNEHDESAPVQDSNSRTNAILKRSVQFIRDARHFFQQGVAPSNDSTLQDQAALEIWKMVRSDVLYHSHTHACYRGTILLYLFQPSRCSQNYYLQVLPQWWTAWTNIDRCPEYDFLWLALLSRARKYVSSDCYDWAPVRKRLLTHSQYWLQLPIGGTTLDKSFPRAGSPRARSCPPRLKVFTGTNSSYDEGIDFVAKVTKLLVAGLGTGQLLETTAQIQPAFTEGTNDVLRFLSYVTPYFHPSNVGQWTFTLGAFLHYFAYEFCSRMGCVAGNQALGKTHPTVVVAMKEAQPGSHYAEIPPHEVVALMDALLPLCQQALYSKNGHVGRAGEAAMLYLVQIDPVNSSPFFVDFACRALDVSAINLSHQAPSALSALTRLVQPALRSNPVILLARLPELLRLSLAGIDSNDQNKCIRTLILYRSLASWVPTGGPVDSWSTVVLNETDQIAHMHDGTLRLGDHLYGDLSDFRKSKEYTDAINRLPSTSLLKQGISVEDDSDPDFQILLLTEATLAMSDWAVNFLERIFGLLRASGEREKTSKRTFTRHSSADVHQARNFSRVLKETLLQVFAGMDEETHRLGVRTVAKFLEEETLPTASKDASLLCQAVAAARLGEAISPGLDALVPLLTDCLSHHSTKTVAYRLRCLAGAVRCAGHGVVEHQSAITEAIRFSLSSDDRHLFKTGCKLLRHTLATLVEAYPIAADSRPRVFLGGSSSSKVYLGRSAQLHRDSVRWHVPNKESINFAWHLLDAHVVQRLDCLCEGTDGSPNGTLRSKMLNALEVNDLRRCLRVVRYAIRGGASVLLEADATSTVNDVTIPYEQACFSAIDLAGDEVRNSLLSIRGRLCSFLVVLATVMAAETLYPDELDKLPLDSQYRKFLPLIGSDPKICKETCDIALLLLTRRGSAFRSTEARTIWKAQKQLSSDYMLCAQVDHMAEALQSASMYGDATALLYKDGEDGGKTLPRRLLVARVQLFHDSLQRNASFEIPRRLRCLEIESKRTARNILFTVGTSLSGMLANLESLLVSSAPGPSDSYEGLADGLYSLCCHSSTQVRSSALSVIDYTMTRFGWLVAIRVPRLLSGLALKDERVNGKFGIPSCARLVGNLNHQGKRKKLAEAVKGVCSILSLSRAMKHVLGNEKLRAQFVLTVCSTDGLISLLPTEEMQKLVHYLQAVFSSFRSKYYCQSRMIEAHHESHEKTLIFILDSLSEKKAEGAVDMDSSSENSGAVHWRKRLLACWFLLSLVEEQDLWRTESSVSKRTWLTCYRIIETEKGQPLQRVALGLFGRLLQIAAGSVVASDVLREKMATEQFCRTLGDALVYDHREDTSVGGGHDAQWATGIEDIIRDAARNVAPRNLFPFQRTSQALGSFKASHAQLIEKVLSTLEEETAAISIQHLLRYSKEIAAAAPSEDQKNQQITSAEIFAGICAFRLRKSEVAAQPEWNYSLLPHLEDVMGKIPFSLSGAYFDAIRFALQFCSPRSFFPLTKWLVDKVSTTLWQPSPTLMDGESAAGEALAQMSIGNSSHGSEGFTAQSKWLYLFTAVLIEMDESEAGNTSPSGWYEKSLTEGLESVDSEDGMEDTELELSWQLVIDRLLPRLTGALGHPFDSCRDHISRCLFRICYCHRKRARIGASRVPSHPSGVIDDDDEALSGDTCDPGTFVVDKLASLENSSGWSACDRYNALSTARRFIAYSVHLGEAKFEYSDYVIPLLPLTFEAIKSTVDDDQAPSDMNQEQGVANRALEAEVIKGYRYLIAELSVTAVISYSKESDVAKVVEVVSGACQHEKWQIRQAAIHFLRCFQGAHQFIFTSEHAAMTMQIVADLLADDRREVSSAALAALTGILAASPVEEVSVMITTYIAMAAKSKKKRPDKNSTTLKDTNAAGMIDDEDSIQATESKRARNQKTAVFFLCAAIMAQPYDTPLYVPAALAAISKHSFERNAPLGVRDTVKRCCAEYKKTHMSDNWEVHRAVFSQEQLEALEDVVSSPHYYA